MSQNLSKLFKKYSHAVWILYFAIYLPWFFWLNHITPLRENHIYLYCRLDDFIPFMEIFIIPYLLWFAYIAIVYVYLFLYNRQQFIRFCIYLYTGMTFCLIFYTLVPNGQNLRVDLDALGRDNLLIELVRSIQTTDTPYDVFPSIHCYNSIVAHIAVMKNEQLKKNPFILWGSFILAVLIILSTVFIKQHSVLDIFGAIAIAIPFYFIAYRIDWFKPKLKKSVSKL